MTTHILSFGLALAFLGSFGTTATEPQRAAPPVYRYKIIHTYPHDPRAFTQGLIYLDGFLYESTGLNGESSLRKVRLETGEVVQRLAVDKRHFAEGLTHWRDSLIQLTWQSNVAFVYERSTFTLQRTLAYPGEGWGLTQDGASVILSDGGREGVIRFLDPESFRETRRLPVKDQGRPVANLNELEFVDGEIWANVWQTDRIARISHASGEVTGWIDLTGLLPDRERTDSGAVLNGIAYDKAARRIFVTGKLWPKLFEIQVMR
jgi:glutamine cyclotransferase